MNAGKQRVLVVDDDEFVYLAVSTIFDKIGYQVVSANNGTEALRLVEAETPRCVFLDIQMPGMDGHEVCSNIRANPRTKDIPVIFVSAKDVSMGFDEEIAAGGNFFVAKPFMPNDLAVDLYFLNELNFKPSRPDLSRLRVTRALPQRETASPAASPSHSAPVADKTATEAVATPVEQVRNRARDEYQKDGADLGDVKELRLLMLSTSYRLSALIRLLEDKGIIRDGDVERTLRSIMQQERPLGRREDAVSRSSEASPHSKASDGSETQSGGAL